MRGRIGTLGAAGLLGLFTIHCGGSGAPSEEDIATTSEAVTSYDHCYAQIERPLPSDATLPIGTQMKLRANPTLICPPGVSETLVYRFYVEGPSGRISPEADNTWSTSRIVPFDSSPLLPGRYRIYLYSLPASLLDAWLAGDTAARQAAHRSGYTYTTFVDAYWTTGAWSACSTPCGGGTQTRSATCVDQNGVERDGMCPGTPITSQSCNTVACPIDGLVVNGTSDTFTVDTYTPPGGWQIYSATSTGYYFLVDFPEKPTAPADYAAFDDSQTWPIPAGDAAVTIFSSDGNLAWTTQSTSAPIHVQTGGDGKLHIVFQDIALPSTSGQPPLSVALDVGFD